MAESFDNEMAADLPLVTARVDLKTGPTNQPNTLSLGQKTFKGALWLTFAAVSAKGINAIGQIVLSWFLDRRDFGLISLAYTVWAFVTILRQTGLRDILVQRQDRFRRWANAAFWMSAAVALLTTLVMVAAAPIAAHIFHAHELVGLLLVLSIFNLLDPIGLLPNARLQIEMRFKLLAVVAIAGCALTAVLSVFMAWAGFGAYSFVWPTVLVSTLTNTVFWLLIRPRIRWNPQIRRWKLLLNDSGMLLGTAFFNSAIWYGDYLMMGLFQSEESAGLYFFAFSLSTQALNLVAYNLGGVIFSALSTANQKPLQQAALFLRATRMLAICAVPVCLTQAALATPLVHLLFAPRWQPTIPIFQLLSIAMVFGVASSHVWGLLKSQGRFRTLLLWTALLSVLFLLLVGLAARRSGPTMVAGVQIGYYCVTSPIAVWLFTRPSQSLGKVYWQLCAVPIFCSALALAPGLLLVHKLSWLQRHDVLQIALVSLSATLLYLALIRLAAREPWNEMMRLVSQWLPSRRRHGAIQA